MPFEFAPDPTLPEVILVDTKRFGDTRGWFAETYHSDAFKAAGIVDAFVQDNHSFSGPRGTVRGLHFQLPPHAQAKLIRCVKGKVVDVAVDVRQSSPRFGQATMVELSAENGRQLYIPAGFAHGFCTVEDACELAYKTSAHYAPEFERGIAHDDPAIGIDWPIPPADRTLSERDSHLPKLADVAELTRLEEHPS